MTQAAWNHDGVLDGQERAKQSNKCVQNLMPHFDQMSDTEKNFVAKMARCRDVFFPSQKQLNWLKDLLEKYDR